MTPLIVRSGSTSDKNCARRPRATPGHAVYPQKQTNILGLTRTQQKCPFVRPGRASQGGAREA
jgi:hypothetical protein